MPIKAIFGETFGFCDQEVHLSNCIWYDQLCAEKGAFFFHTTSRGVAETFYLWLFTCRTIACLHCQTKVHYSMNTFLEPTDREHNTEGTLTHNVLVTSQDKYTKWFKVY